MRLIALSALLCALAAPAAAQSFPDPSEYVDGVCDGAPASDPIGDTAGAAGAFDVVGVPDRPCFGYAADTTFLYMRLRVDADPRESMSPLRWRSGGWGFLFDANDNLRR
ncbi:MAG: hypothetical protein AB8I08_08050 [Sandaracinaceae bacterium]